MCYQGVVYGTPTLKYHSSHTLGGAKSQGSLTADLGAADIGDSVGASKAVAENGVGTQYLDELQISSKSLKRGAKVILEETLIVTPRNVQLSCSSSGNQGGAATVTSFIGVGSTDRQLTITGACNKSKFEWYLNNNPADAGTKLSHKVDVRVGDTGSLQGSNLAGTSSFGDGPVAIEESNCYTLRALTKRAAIVTASGHDYSRCP